MRREFLHTMLLLTLASASVADSLTTTRIVRSQTVLSAADLEMISDDNPTYFSSAEEAVGLEARVALYPGRPVEPGDIGPPALVERNGAVTLVFQKGGLIISADGRSLDRAGLGEVARAMNLASRTVVSGVVTSSGTIRVLAGDR